MNTNELEQYQTRTRRQTWAWLVATVALGALCVGVGYTAVTAGGAVWWGATAGLALAWGGACTGSVCLLIAGMAVSAAIGARLAEQKP